MFRRGVSVGGVIMLVDALQDALRLAGRQEEAVLVRVQTGEGQKVELVVARRVRRRRGRSGAKVSQVDGVVEQNDRDPPVVVFGQALFPAAVVQHREGNVRRQAL